MTQSGDIDAFFRAYARASTSLDPVATAAFYTPTFIAAGPSGSGAFPNNERFLAWLQRVFDFNQHTGMTSLGIVAVESRRLSDNHALASVTWGARFEKTGDDLHEFETTYLLENFGEGWKILASIDHSDQEAEMRRLGLLNGGEPA